VDTQDQTDWPESGVRVPTWQQAVDVHLSTLVLNDPKTLHRCLSICAAACAGTHCCSGATYNVGTN